MHQAQWSPERPLPPPVSLASQSHHEKPPEDPMNSMKRQNDRILKEFPRSAGAQYATGDQWRNNSRKNEGMEPKQKECPAVDVTSDRSKVQRCKEQ